MKDPYKDRDECDAPSPARPQEGAIWWDRGVQYVWHNGGWWMPITLPLAVYYEHLTRELARYKAATTIPRP